MFILFKFASRSRPTAFFKAIDNIYENLANKKDYHILVSIDQDDRSMNNIEIFNKIKERKGLNITVVVGNSKSKIQAINADVNQIGIEWDILVNVSDDQPFVKHGFDNIIRSEMRKNFPDLDGFLHFPDQQTGNTLCTMSILGRMYYTRTNYIYNPKYYSFFCDDEATQVAKILGKYKFIDEKIFEHHHVAWGYGKRDELLIRNDKYWRKDKRTFQLRKLNKFDL